MALPSLDELRRLRESVPGLGQGIASGTQGVVSGMELASTIQNRQQQLELRKEALKNAVEALDLKKTKTQADVEHTQADTELKKKKLNEKEGIPILNDKGEIVTYVPKGAKFLPQGISSPLALSRIISPAISNMDKSTDVSRNKTIIERGQRIESITDPTKIIQDPGVLDLVRTAVEAQTRGGVASVAGVKQLRNETFEQYWARLKTKLLNAPQDAATQDFVGQLKNISKAESKKAIMGLEGSVLAAAAASAEGIKGSFPGVDKHIKDAGNVYIKTYLENTLGKDVPEGHLDPKAIDKLLEEEKKEDNSGGTDSLSPAAQQILLLGQ